MAIAKMMKFNLYTTKSKEDDILFELHKYGKIQIDKVEVEEGMESIEEFFTFDKSSSDIDEIHNSISKINYMINVLTPFEKKVPMLEKYKKGKPNLDYVELSKVNEKIEINRVYDEVKFEDDNIKEITQEVSLLKSQNEELNKYMKFDMDEKDFKKLKFHVAFIGSLPNRNYSKLIKELDEREVLYYLEDLGVIKEDKLFFIITDKETLEITEEVLRDNGFSKLNNQFKGIPKDIMRNNTNKIEQISQDKIQHTEKLKLLADNLPLLQEAYDFYENERLREEAKNNILRSDKFLVIQGWFLKDDNDEFQKLLKDNLGSSYFIEMEDAEKDDENVPIVLKNNLLNSSFESITQMYAYPRYNEIDPTPVLTPFYLVFFGMMLADVGYGLLLLIATSIALKFFNLAESQRKFLRFFFFLSIPTIIVGFIYGGFFGDAIKIPALISPSEDLMTVLAISIVLGVIQIFFGLGVKAYMLIRDGKALDAVFDVVTWYFALIGAIGLLLTLLTDFLPKSMSSVFTIMMVIGMAGIVLTNGRENKSFFGKAVGGLYALYNITGYIGDFVSYCRIMALGLSGGYIAFAFNMIIGMLPVWARFTIGIFIFVFAHLFNLFLSALSAYVHTCRLHYVEYFGKFYEGGGKPFKAFRSSNKYIEINDK